MNVKNMQSYMCIITGTCPEKMADLIQAFEAENEVSV